MRIADKIAAWLLMLMGVMHAGATFIAFPRFTLNAIWFLSAAIAIWLTAGLNLLRIYYSALVPALARVAVIANVLLIFLDLGIALQVPLRGNPQVIVLLVLLAFLTVTSFRHSYPAVAKPQ